MTPEELSEIEEQCEKCSVSYDGKEFWKNRNMAYGLKGEFIVAAPNYIRRLIAHIRDLEAQIPNWIHIGERLPETYEDILFCQIEFGEMSIRSGYYDPSNPEFPWHVYDSGKGFNHHKDWATHWLELPKCPKETP